MADLAGLDGDELLERIHALQQERDELPGRYASLERTMENAVEADELQARAVDGAAELRHLLTLWHARVRDEAIVEEQRRRDALAPLREAIAVERAAFEVAERRWIEAQRAFRRANEAVSVARDRRVHAVSRLRDLVATPVPWSLEHRPRRRRWREDF